MFTRFVQEIKKAVELQFLILYTAINLGFKGCARKQSFYSGWEGKVSPKSHKLLIS